MMCAQDLADEAFYDLLRKPRQAGDKRGLNAEVRELPPARRHCNSRSHRPLEWRVESGRPGWMSAQTCSTGPLSRPSFLHDIKQPERPARSAQHSLRDHFINTIARSGYEEWGRSSNGSRIHTEIVMAREGLAGPERAICDAGRKKMTGERLEQVRKSVRAQLRWASFTATAFWTSS